MSGETKLKDKLKSLLEKDMRQAVAKEIERASAELGEDHFVFGPESQTLAEMDLGKFRAFTDRVVRIRQDLEVQYYIAIKGLAGEDNEA